jgi:hypothetical protein
LTIRQVRTDPKRTEASQSRPSILDYSSPAEPEFLIFDDDPIGKSYDNYCIERHTLPFTLCAHATSKMASTTGPMLSSQSAIAHV